MFDCWGMCVNVSEKHFNPQLFKGLLLYMEGKSSPWDFVYLSSGTLSFTHTFNLEHPFVLTDRDSYTFPTYPRGHWQEELGEHSAREIQTQAEFSLRPPDWHIGDVWEIIFIFC